MPPPSSQEQPLKARFTQAQPGFFAHSGSQPQAAPPGALSSQYQPVGQSASPHGAQVPSSQLAFVAAASSWLGSSLPSSAPSDSASPPLGRSESAPSGAVAGFSAPPQPTERAKRASPRARALRTIMPRRYPEPPRAG